MTQSDDPFGVLGVAPTATATEVRRAYYRLSLKWHPDHHMQAGPEAIARAEAIFKSVNHAFVVASQILQTGVQATPVQVRQRTQQEVQLATVAHAVTQSRLMMVAQYWALNPYTYRRDVEITRLILSDAVVFGARAFPRGFDTDLPTILREQSLASEEEHVRALLTEAMQLIIDRAQETDVAAWETVFRPLGYRPLTPASASVAPKSVARLAAPATKGGSTVGRQWDANRRIAGGVGGVGIVLVLASIPLAAHALLASAGVFFILVAVGIIVLL